jgi:hypothetical protein
MVEALVVIVLLQMHTFAELQHDQTLARKVYVIIFCVLMSLWQIIIIVLSQLHSYETICNILRQSAAIVILYDSTMSTWGAIKRDAMFLNLATQEDAHSSSSSPSSSHTLPSHAAGRTPISEDSTPLLQPTD